MTLTTFKTIVSRIRLFFFKSNPLTMFDRKLSYLIGLFEPYMFLWPCDKKLSRFEGLFFLSYVVDHATILSAKRDLYHFFNCCTTMTPWIARTNNNKKKNQTRNTLYNMFLFYVLYWQFCSLFKQRRNISCFEKWMFKFNQSPLFLEVSKTKSFLRDNVTFLHEGRQLCHWI